MISAEFLESRLPVGSSASTTAGAFMRARPMATRCCWPPESWLGRWCSRPARPSLLSSAVRRRSFTLRPSMSTGRHMFSTTSSTGTRL